MNTARVAAALLLLTGGYVLITATRQESSSGSSGGGWLSDAADSVAETVEAVTGVSVGNSRYVAALNDPANEQIIGLLNAAEARHGLPAGLLVRQAWQESRFNTSAVNAWSGAKGLMQFMPATAAEWGVSVFDPASSADGAARYMVWLYGKLGSWSLALAAYNWGIGNVMRKGMDAAPKETRDYVAQIGADAGVS
jgi:soluble lytic murein transglycosylase-like protein